MFDDKNILQFIKRIIEKEPDEEKAIKLIKEFKENLELTKMADKKSLDQIDSIIETLPAGYKLSKLLDEDEPITLVKKKKYENRHYKNYHSTSSNYSSGCGGSSSYSGYSSGCGGGSSSYSSYSSGCGGGSSSYSSGC